MNKSCPACDRKHIVSFNFGPLLRCADCGFVGYPVIFSETNSGPTWTPVETFFTFWLMALAAIIACGILGG